MFVKIMYWITTFLHGFRFLPLLKFKWPFNEPWPMSQEKRALISKDVCAQEQL
jgi:hypothetical protein